MPAGLGATIMIIVAKGPDFRSLRSVVALTLRVPNWIALVTDVRADAVGVMAFVGDDDGARLETIERDFGGRHVVVVSRRDQEADRPAFRVDACGFSS